MVMTWSLTLAWLPRAGGNSKHHRYKQIVQKRKDLPKTWVLGENSVKISDEKKEQKHYSRPKKKPVEHKDSESTEQGPREK